MEVSMPTGSLCAERNVIGTALGKNLCVIEIHSRVKFWLKCRSHFIFN